MEHAAYRAHGQALLLPCELRLQIPLHEGHTPRKRAGACAPRLAPHSRLSQTQCLTLTPPARLDQRS